MTRANSSYRRDVLWGFTFGMALGTMIGGAVLSLFVWWWFIPTIFGVGVSGFLIGEEWGAN